MAADSIAQITVAELAALRSAGDRRLLLLDVREPWEHAIAKLPDSVLIPLGELPEIDDSEDALWGRLGRQETGARPPEAPRLIVAYCHHGVRSLNAAAILSAKGIGPVCSLSGGIDAWSRQIDPSLARY
jgi:rhodanese-related sulfurtransferase